MERATKAQGRDSGPVHASPYGPAASLKRAAIERPNARLCRTALRRTVRRKHLDSSGRPCASKYVRAGRNEGPVLAVEGPFPVFFEGAEPDILFRLGAPRVSVVASMSLSSSDAVPSRCLADCAGVAWRLDEGLDEDGGGSLAFGTVAGGRWRGGASRCLGISIQGRMRNLVIDHEANVLLAQLRRRADEEVAQGELLRGAAVAEHGERPSILRLRSHFCGGTHFFELLGKSQSLIRAWPLTKFPLTKL